ncbi:TonB-dependent receptor [Niastella populi]|uniref:TonB-dependent receptor n=1 Tax=Niastella populi TaxID=550983 RepID=A0A1V9EU64_9BACT|nr:TonB-dependent receptor [Niastella populi]OQP49690.1 TonB-dependent receptor [Niastella populi]
MRKYVQKAHALTVLLFLYCSMVTFSQVTTATLSGIVRDPKGTPLPAATVVIEWADAGFKQTLPTKGDGRFTVPNLRVGGPYTVTVTFINFQTSVTENVFLELGQNNSLEVQMKEKAGELKEVTITSRSAAFDNKKTGASMNINSRLIRSLPTISRSADDYLRLTPSASFTYNGLSFAGRNGQYNNFSLDGAVFNNPFGLDAPTPGGQTGAQPISLDAIDQIQVNIAPYDVTQAGFTGAGINTVTKSGNNKISGTVYGFYRNQSLTGKKIEKNKLVLPDLKQLQAGFSLGGPVIKNKLFYFVNFETEQRSDQASSYVAQNGSNAGKTNTSRVLESDLQQVSAILRSKFNYETGPYQQYTLDQKNYKWLIKADWNINANHRLSFTYNGLDAHKDKPAHPSAIGRRGPDFTTLQFQNSGYEIVNKLQSFGAELKSTFGADYANKLRVVYTTFRDKRNPFSTPFPVINITKNGVRYIIAGHEPFSINNRLNQDAFQITNNFNMFFKKHTVTAGASFESFKFANSFNLTGYGATLFSEADIKTFIDSVPASGSYVFGAYPLDVDVAYARNRGMANQWTWYYLTVGQLSAYLQDEWQATDKFRVTYGLRMDVPFYFNASYRNPVMNADGTFGNAFDEGEPTFPNNDNLTLFDEDGNPLTNGAGKDVDNTRLPAKKLLLSPRVGFNWDIKGDKSVQLRGGTGLFTGRFPFVWLGNHIGNPYSFFYNVTDRDFKWPQVWRSNLGADYKIPFGTIFTVDVAYTKDINGMMVRNYKLGTPSGTLNSGTGDTRRIYLAGDQGSANTYAFTNTSVGYQFNTTFQAQQFFAGGFYAMVGYNYLIAKDASSISAEISSDAFDRNPILNNANAAVLSRSLYGNTHRIVAAFTKKFSYDEHFATTVSLFGSWNSGNRFAYVYGGDINNDGTGTNDLLYVPTDAEINTMQFAPLIDVNGNVQNAAAQRQGLRNFIANDKYLSKRRGEFTEKYAGENPWVSQVDLRILQDFIFPVGKRTNTVQLSLDFVNLGNLLNSNWGVVKYATTSGYLQPLSVSYNNNNPVYQFDPSLTSTFIASPDLQSRWQMQIGLRYIF